MNICLFKPEEIQMPLSIKDERGEHIVKVLHKKVGDSFSAGIIEGSAGFAVITKIENNQIFFDFVPDPSLDEKKLFPLKMIIGFPRPIQLKRLLRDIAALGVCEVHLTGTELGEKSYMQSTLVEKGNAYKMLLDGTVQAGSTHVPALFLHQTLKECLDFINENSKNYHHSLRLCLDNVNPKCSVSMAMKDFPCLVCKNPCDENKAIVGAIGSERGWTEQERKLLEEYGYIRCSMGSRIMRTETAATVAGSIILNTMGYLN